MHLRFEYTLACPRLERLAQRGTRHWHTDMCQSQCHYFRLQICDYSGDRRAGKIAQRRFVLNRTEL